MPDLFTVTTATNTIKLDSKRQAEASFAVFNSSGQPMRGRARIVVVKPDAGKPSPGIEPPKPEADKPGSDAEKWLTLEGEAEREFPIAGAQQYTVNIAVPKDAQPGNYTFRLDMVGVAVPDEQLAEGPSVTFEAPAKGGDDRRWLWILLAVIAALVVVGGIVIFLLTRPPGPDVNATPTPTATSTAAPTSTPAPAATKAPLAGAARYVGDWDRQGLPAAGGISEMVIDQSTGGKLFVQFMTTNAAKQTTQLGIAANTFTDDPFKISLSASNTTHEFSLTPNSDASRLTVFHVFSIGTFKSSEQLAFNRATRFKHIDPGIIKGVKPLPTAIIIGP